MRFACCTPENTNTHTEYVIITACPWQQWLRESARILRYTYTACLTVIQDYLRNLEESLHSTRFALRISV